MDEAKDRYEYTTEKFQWFSTAMKDYELAFQHGGVVNRWKNWEHMWLRPEIQCPVFGCYPPDLGHGSQPDGFMERAKYFHSEVDKESGKRFYLYNASVRVWEEHVEPNVDNYTMAERNPEKYMETRHCLFSPGEPHDGWATENPARQESMGDGSSDGTIGESCESSCVGTETPRSSTPTM